MTPCNEHLLVKLVRVYLLYDILTTPNTRTNEEVMERRERRSKEVCFVLVFECACLLCFIFFCGGGHWRSERMFWGCMIETPKESIILLKRIFNSLKGSYKETNKNKSMIPNFSAKIQRIKHCQRDCLKKWQHQQHQKKKKDEAITTETQGTTENKSNTKANNIITAFNIHLL